MNGINEVNERWIYAGIVATILNIFYIVYASRTHWSGSNLYMFSSEPLMMTIFLSVIVTVLILMYTIAGAIGMGKSAASSYFTHIVITAGTYFDASQIPFKIRGIYQTILKVAVFTGEPITYLIFIPVVTIWTGVTLILRAVISNSF